MENSHYSSITPKKKVIAVKFKGIVSNIFEMEDIKMPNQGYLRRKAKHSGVWGKALYRIEDDFLVYNGKAKQKKKNFL